MILQALHYFHVFLLFGGWVFIWGIDMWLRVFSRHVARMKRGKYYRWTLRTFGFMAESLPRMILASVMLLVMVAPPHWMGAIDVFYLFIAITCAVDYITGGEDPPWRKLSRAGAELLKKLQIRPAPQPAINV